MSEQTEPKTNEKSKPALILLDNPEYAVKYIKYSHSFETFKKDIDSMYASLVERGIIDEEGCITFTRKTDGSVEDIEVTELW